MANEITPPEPDSSSLFKRLRRHAVWRLFGWGSAACLALAAVALTSQTEAGSQRLRLALAPAREPVQVIAQLPPRTAEVEAETERLTAQLRDLTADRDRLTARIASLEHNLNDMTGSIKRQSEQIAAARAANVPPPAPSTPATTPVVVVKTAPAPVPANLPWFVAMRTPQPAEPPIPPEAVDALGGAVPLPPVRVAVAPANGPLPGKDEFAIDLGGAANIEALRSHWAALQAKYGALLKGLHPVVSHHLKLPTGYTYRLLAGPLPSSEDAARLCSRFAGLRTGCRPAKFTGTQLAEH
jgi:hypothetical protein